MQIHNLILMLRFNQGILLSPVTKAQRQNHRLVGVVKTLYAAWHLVLQ